MDKHELVDLVDSCGTIQVRGVQRSEVKRRAAELQGRGLYQPIVVVVVLDQSGRVVAQVRGERKADDGSFEVDHVCGVIRAGEDWRAAAHREAAEEIGVSLADLTLVAQGVNVYQRYRTLAVAYAVGTPTVIDQREVARVFRASPQHLRQMSREAPFVRGYFEDLGSAMRLLNMEA